MKIRLWWFNWRPCFFLRVGKLNLGIQRQRIVSSKCCYNKWSGWFHYGKKRRYWNVFKEGLSVQ